MARRFFAVVVCAIAAAGSAWAANQQDDEAYYFGVPASYTSPAWPYPPSNGVIGHLTLTRCPIGNARVHLPNGLSFWDIGVGNIQSQIQMPASTIEGWLRFTDG